VAVEDVDKILVIGYHDVIEKYTEFEEPYVVKVGND
jgi:hypothetical protein